MDPQDDRRSKKRYGFHSTELELLAAVLDQSYDDFIFGPLKTDFQRWAFDVRKEAYAWIMSDSTEPLTFSWTCDALGLYPSAVRKRWLDQAKKHGVELPETTTDTTSR